MMSSNLTYLGRIHRDSNQANRRRLMVEWATGTPPSLVTRHILLVRHGQYHEQHNEDRDMTLTSLGQKQAKKTGERIAKIIQHNNSQNQLQHGPIKVFAVSDLTRAKQTADIIHKELELLYSKHNAEHPTNPWEGPLRNEPDPLLNEGIPGMLSVP
jgi:serine/threonine-protein phosphatase PGAM5